MIVGPAAMVDHLIVGSVALMPPGAETGPVSRLFGLAVLILAAGFVFIVVIRAAAAAVDCGRRFRRSRKSRQSARSDVAERRSRLAAELCMVETALGATLTQVPIGLDEEHRAVLSAYRRSLDELQ